MRKTITTCMWLFSAAAAQASPALFPNICSVVNTPYFDQSMELTYHQSMCGHPVPRPCIHFSYYVPKYFIEVVGNPKETFFGALPGVKVQMQFLPPGLPFAAEDDFESYSYHAHTINIPFAQWAFNELPCGDALPDVFCFSAMSEHLGSHWRTGAADLWQPAFQAWALSPQTCLVKGAITSATGGSVGGVGASSPLCSFAIDWLARYPPSAQPVCTGWGIHFPRTGTVTSSDQTTASLVIASRIRSIGAEVFQSVFISPDEKWQMISPQASSCFREGQNIGILAMKGVNELGRLKGNFNNYLYAVWQRTSCTRDVPWLVTTKLWINGLKAVCKASG